MGVSGEWDDLVVVCGTTFWSGTRLLDQHVAEHLTRYAPVLFVDPPVSVLSRFRNPEARTSAAAPGLHQVAPRLAVVSPRVLPLKERPVGKEIALALTRRAMRRAVRELGSRSVRAVIVPSLNPLFGAVGERFSVFYAKDDYLAGAGLMGIDRRRLERRAARQPRDADVVVAVSPTLVAGYRRDDVEALLVPNGCDVAPFEHVAAPAAEDPVVAFVGHLSDRVDVALLDAVAATGVRVRIVGARQQTMTAGHFDAVLARPNVEWTGPVPYADLPEVLADVTTCLLPYADNDFNRASFPLKILEYLAAGRRVVATDLPAVRWLDTALISTASSPDGFAAAVTASLAEPLSADEVRERQSYAATHSWERRARTVAEALELTGAALTAPSGGDEPAPSSGGSS
jgi:teichuronic acid biosynthesis glycosyltransferase TuaH